MVHILTWGLLRNRTVESFERFFVFTAKFYPGLTSFMCDRSFSQKRVLRRAFGCNVRIFHFMVHIGRNIKRNAGANSPLSSLFWRMRSERSEESGRRFLSALRQRHETKPSAFTAQLLNAVESFLPPMVDDVLKARIFPQLGILETIDITAFDVVSVEERRAVSTLLALKRLPVFCHDVFSRDNTNAIECFFSVLKRRTPEENATLLDVFKAFDFSEEVQLRKRDPSVPTLPHELKAVLDVFIPSDVQGVMTKRGVDGFISTLITTCIVILSRTESVMDKTEALVHRAIATGSMLTGLTWVRDGWLSSPPRETPSHQVLHVMVDGETFCPRDILSRETLCPLYF